MTRDEMWTLTEFEGFLWANMGSQIILSKYSKKSRDREKYNYASTQIAEIYDHFTNMFGLKKRQA